jgi:hypothetical protein
LGKAITLVQILHALDILYMAFFLTYKMKRTYGLTLEEWTNNGKDEERQPADDERAHDDPQSCACLMVLESHWSEFF